MALWVCTGMEDERFLTENPILQPDPQCGNVNLQPEEISLQRGWRKRGKMKVDEEDLRFYTTVLRQAS